jgi:ribosomal protein S6--L-glutamate ligase
MTNWVKFDINPIQNNLKTIIHCEATLVDKRIVKVRGFREQRYVIQTSFNYWRFKLAY